MENNSVRNLAIAAAVIGLIWWFFPRHEDEPPAPAPVAEVPAEPPAAPEAEPVKETPAPVAEAPKEEEEVQAPAIGPDEIKALRQQAKSVLSQFYSSQRAFHMEFNRYTTDLKAGGWLPNAGIMNYKLGFLSEARTPPNNNPDEVFEDPRRMSTDEFDGDNYTSRERFAYSREVQGATLQEYATLCKNGCTADAGSFEVMLIIPLGDTRHIDVWLINEKKELLHVRDGITGRAPEPPP